MIVGRKERRLKKLKNVLETLLRKGGNVADEKECHGEQGWWESKTYSYSGKWHSSSSKQSTQITIGLSKSSSGYISIRTDSRILTF